MEGRQSPPDLTLHGGGKTEPSRPHTTRWREDRALQTSHYLMEGRESLTDLTLPCGGKTEPARPHINWWTSCVGRSTGDWLHTLGKGSKSSKGRKFNCSSKDEEK
jgi:hypothetical protein